MSDDCKAAMIEAGVPYPCASDCRCALEIENKALRAENARLRKILKSMDDTIVARSELFISDQECLFNLRDRIRRALETKKAPAVNRGQ